MGLLERRQAYCKTICKAWCCKFLVFEKDYVDQDDKLFFSLRGVFIEKDTNKLIVPLRCKWLTNHNICKMYMNRPKSCIAYECEKLKAQGAILNYETS